MIPLAMPNLTGNEKNYLDNCIDTTYVSSVGEYVNLFEEMVAEATGSKYAVATSAGTTGLHAALTAVGVGRDDLVILPTFTFIASANAIKHCGADPWLMDINESDWCLNVDQVETELQSNCEKQDDRVIHKLSGRRVVAIMPVYTLGAIPDMERLRSIAKEWDLPLVADAACAIGAKYKGADFGSLADLSVLSFNGNKTITCGGGGAVVGNNKNLLNLVRHLTTTARVWPDYDFDMVGFNYRMTNIQAAVGCAQMERLGQFIGIKERVRAYYEKNLADTPNIKFFPTPDGCSCWFSGVVLRDQSQLATVKRLTDALKERGMEARPFWKPVHLQEPYKDSPVADVSVAESLWQRVVTLPCSTNIKDEELATVVKTVSEDVRTVYFIEDAEKSIKSHIDHILHIQQQLSQCVQSERRATVQSYYDGFMNSMVYLYEHRMMPTNKAVARLMDKLMIASSKLAFDSNKYLQTISELLYWIHGIRSGFEVEAEVKLNPENGSDVDVRYKAMGYTYNLEVKCPDQVEKESDKLSMSMAFRGSASADVARGVMEDVAGLIQHRIESNPDLGYTGSQIEKLNDNKMLTFLESAQKKFIYCDDLNVLVVSVPSERLQDYWGYLYNPFSGIFTEEVRQFKDKDGNEKSHEDFDKVDVVILTNIVSGHDKTVEGNDNGWNPWYLENYCSLLCVNPYARGHGMKDFALTQLNMVIPNDTIRFEQERDKAMERDRNMLGGLPNDVMFVYEYLAIHYPNLYRTDDKRMSWFKGGKLNPGYVNTT